MKKWAAFVSIAVIVSGCVQAYGLKKPGPHSVNGAYQIETQNAWSQANLVTFKPWTIDGDHLQMLMLFGGIRDGDAIFGRGAALAEAPKYASEMRETDIAELVEASFEFIGMSDFSVRDLRPAPFDELPGFRFEYEFIAESGLKYRGDAFGAIDEKQRLNLILYSGARLHYYEKHQEKVERIFASVKVL